ncbi:MAG: TIGR03621 family F420-dependent LLM class oxidoreductase [Acidimicrobiales bacterium]
MSDFRFGVQLKGVTSGRLIRQCVERAEALGYDTVTLPDHLDAQWSPLSTLGFLAGLSKTMSFGSLVMNNDLRHPVLVAREAATIAEFSGGRFELGLGAGWLSSDYHTLGLTMDPPPVRVRRLSEALMIITQLFEGEEVTHVGEFYTVNGATLGVAGAPQTRPKMVIGGGGRQVLGLAAHYGDVIGVNPKLSAGTPLGVSPEELSFESFQSKVRHVAESLGRHGRSAELQCRTVLVRVGPSAVAEVGDLALAFGLGLEDVASMPPILFGEPEKIVDDLVERRERLGLSYWIVHEDELEMFAPVVAILRGR